MWNHFRLTSGWHAPRIFFGPATIAPLSGSSLRRTMAATPLRPVSEEKIERMEDRFDKERAKAVELAVGQIEKQFGKGSIMRLGGKDAIAPIATISTGSISVDDGALHALRRGSVRHRADFTGNDVKGRTIGIVAEPSWAKPRRPPSTTGKPTPSWSWRRTSTT